MTCTDKTWSHRFLLYSRELSVISENNYSLELINSYPDDVSFYKVTVSPPVSFTCVREGHFRGNITKLQSETYIFNQSGYPTIQVNKISGNLSVLDLMNLSVSFETITILSLTDCCTGYWLCCTLKLYPQGYLVFIARDCIMYMPKQAFGFAFLCSFRSS